MSRDAIFAGLNDEQRRAVETVRGPVCILAGAGSGKTTTITRRIAWQVASATVRPGEILAVTFTDKAAREMRSRLAVLGVAGVAARTFHAAALAQLHHFRPDDRRVLPSKVLLLRRIADSLPGAYRFRPAADLATEIEWAKNRRLTPASYRRSLEGHEQPLPADLMERVFREYEGRKGRLGLVDFEDLLEGAIRLFDEDGSARLEFRDRYRAFTVDEYQDVNLLQQELLERWLGERDELCAVGDDYQSIYGFTGASPSYLLEMPLRFPHATVVRLEDNYRSTPEILALANRIVPRLGGSDKVLRATRTSGPEPALSVYPAREDEVAGVAERIRVLAAEGVPWEEIAVLYRTNARSEEFEEALAEAGIPYQVRGGSFLEREAARRVAADLASSLSTDVAATVRAAARRQGLLERGAKGLGEHETTRQEDLARLVELAEGFDGGGRTVADYLAHLRERFAAGDGERGVHLLTYHRAKGLEFEAVFLPLLEDKELPARPARGDEAVAEERRLLYVGITRAKRHLFLSRAAGGKPSRFVSELGLRPPRGRPEAPAVEACDDPAFDLLRRWRLERARADGIPAYVVFHDRTLVEIARLRPRSEGELAEVSGVGPAKLERYGEEVLRALAGV